MDAKEVVVGGLSVLVFLALVIFFVLLGWYVVWWLFLSRFKFIRELLGNHQEPAAVTAGEEQQRGAGRSRPPRKARRD